MPRGTGNRQEKGRWLKASWHPTQVEALTILTERVASPKEIATVIGQPLVRNVSYHVRELEKRGLVELVDTKQRRGAVEHFYKAVVRPALATNEWEQADREEISVLAMQLFLQDVGLAMEGETFDEFPERHLSRAPLVLDREGFLELAREQDRLLDRSLEIQAKSDERRADSGEEGIPVSSLMAAFTLPRGRGGLDQSAGPSSKT